jgi:hypothetical protein
LQGETPTPPTTQQTETQGLETRISSRQDARENFEETETSIKKAEEKPQSTSGKPATVKVGKQPSIEIGNPIQSVTPL